MSRYNSRSQSDDLFTLDDDKPPSTLENDDFGQPLIDNDNVRFLVNANSEITNIVNNLRGRFKMKDGQYKKMPGLKPIMNDKGVIHVYTFLNMTLTKITSMGMLKPDEAKERTLYLITPLIIQTALNENNWNVNLPEMSVVIPAIEGLIYSHLTRSINRGEAKLLSGIVSQDEHITREDKSQSIKL